MPEFSLGFAKEKTVRVNRRQVFFICEFRLPDEVKEHIPFDETALIESDRLMGFYCVPANGDEINFMGHKWSVRTKAHWPSRRSSRDKKIIPIVKLDYQGLTDSMDDDDHE